MYAPALIPLLIGARFLVVLGSSGTSTLVPTIVKVWGMASLFIRVSPWVRLAMTHDGWNFMFCVVIVKVDPEERSEQLPPVVEPPPPPPPHAASSIAAANPTALVRRALCFLPVA